jgi:dienelactone hydrolase
MDQIAQCRPWEPDCHDYTDGSPLLHLDQLHAPVLLHHSEADTAASYPAALDLDHRLERLQIPHKLFVYRSQDYGPVGHGFLYPILSSYNQAAADASWKMTIQALDYYLKGKGSKPW